MFAHKSAKMWMKENFICGLCKCFKCWMGLKNFSVTWECQYAGKCILYRILCISLVLLLQSATYTNVIHKLWFTGWWNNFYFRKYFKNPFDTSNVLLGTFFTMSKRNSINCKRKRKVPLISVNQFHMVKSSTHTAIHISKIVVKSDRISDP